MSKTIYHSTLGKEGPKEVKVTGDTYKTPWTDKKTGDQVYSVKLEAEGVTQYFSTTVKAVADYLSSFKDQVVKISAAEGKKITVEGGESEPAGKVTTEEAKKRYTGKGNGGHSPETQARIERQHSQEMALRFMQVGSAEPTLNLVQELTDWFQNDLNKSPRQKKPSPMPEPERLDENGEPVW